MSSLHRQCIALIVLAAAAAGCTNANADAQHAAKRSMITTSSKPLGSACDQHLLIEADAQSVLSQSITAVTPLPGDPQSCIFTAGDARLTVSLRPGLGNVTVDTWLAGKMPVPATPLDGVGDRAAWQSTLNEVIATRNNLLCDISVEGAGAPTSGEPLSKRAGALCNKIFASAT